MSRLHSQMSGSARQKRNAKILAASDVCHICGHPGADAVDHVVPLARGGSDIDPLNLRPAHHNTACPTCGIKCNQVKGDKLMADVDRKVLLICGPPGAGKTTMAHGSGLEVYDLDDERWGGSDPLFRASLVRVRENPKARAAVIRSAATLNARRRAAVTCGATDVVVLETPVHVCIERIRERGRTVPPLNFQIKGAQEWWRKY